MSKRHRDGLRFRDRGASMHFQVAYSSNKTVGSLHRLGSFVIERACQKEARREELLKAKVIEGEGGLRHATSRSDNVFSNGITRNEKAATGGQGPCKTKY